MRKLDEQKFFISVLNTCKNSDARESYVALRHLPIAKPVLTEKEFIEHIANPELELVAEHIRAAYKEAPLVHAKADHFHCCALCDNLLLRTNKDTLICEDARCRTKPLAYSG